MSIVKVSWSGGKDSTCAVMKHIERGDKVKIVTYIPMFTEDIPLITKEHYNFIMETAKKFRKLGADVNIITGETYQHFVLRRSSRGKFKGRMFGFPPFRVGLCNFKRDSKVKSLVEFDVGSYDYEDIGIASDETKRHNQLNEKKRSILCELNITEKQARKYCEEKEILSPHYKYNNRDGCALCPNKKAEERKRWFNDYPQAIPILIELQQIIHKERPEQTPLRNHKWFLENDNGEPITMEEWEQTNDKL